MEITKKIYSEISAGELFDKISILEIKKNKIKDKTKRKLEGFVIQRVNRQRQGHYDYNHSSEYNNIIATLKLQPKRYKQQHSQHVSAKPK